MRATRNPSAIALWVIGVATTQALFIACATYPDAANKGVATANEVAASKAAVRSLLQNQVDAWNRADLNGFLEAYSDSPDLLFFSNGRTYRGRREIEAVMRERYT